ncbi:MAG: gliding motility protein GldN [Bacteroidetes bacterium]|nr:gliding motility protein GldN [Bacteroidota bacterium]
MSILKPYKLFAPVALIFSSAVTYAQSNLMDQAQSQSPVSESVVPEWQPSLVRDGVIDHQPHVNQPLKWQPVREADVLYKKRVWREIDTRQKQNMAFRFPGDDNSGGGMFIEILLDGVKKGKIKAYSTMDDRFTSAFNKSQILEMTAGKTDSTPVVDPVTGETVIKVTHTEFNPDLVTKFRIKEDWIFDRNLGRMVVRIIGIAPLLDRYNDDGSFRASSPMFWIYYPEVRDLLAQYEVFNPDNDVARMNWDEYFENRFFASYIIKVSNPFDNSFTGMGLQGTDALYEGARWSETIFNKEHDMWVY